MANERGRPRNDGEVGFGGMGGRLGACQQWEGLAPGAGDLRCMSTLQSEPTCSLCFHRFAAVADWKRLIGGLGAYQGVRGKSLSAPKLPDSSTTPTCSRAHFGVATCYGREKDGVAVCCLFLCKKVFKHCEAGNDNIQSHLLIKRRISISMCSW